MQVLYKYLWHTLISLNHSFQSLVSSNTPKLSFSINSGSKTSQSSNRLFNSLYCGCNWDYSHTGIMGGSVHLVIVEPSLERDSAICSRFLSRYFEWECKLSPRLKHESKNFNRGNEISNKMSNSSLLTNANFPASTLATVYIGVSKFWKKNLEDYYNSLPMKQHLSYCGLRQYIFN